VQVPKDAKTGVEELDPTNTEGDDSDGAAGQERTVPLSVVKALRKSNEALKTQLARVEGTVDGLKAGQPKPSTATRDYTRAELRALVNDGKITEDQMDATLEAQAEKRVTAKTEALVEERVTETRSTAKIEAEIDRYVEAFPDVNEDGSDTREKVSAQFSKLVARGFPKTLSTELTAMEMALGALGGTPKGRKKAPETHTETGNGGGGAEHVDDAGWAKGLTPREKTHYEKLVARSVYSGYSDKLLVREVKRIQSRGKAN
jgi:hypothetical protein